jgi:hypothetical protein
MNLQSLKVEIRPATRPGAVKAFADVDWLLPEGTLMLRGFSIVQTDGKPAFVGFPSKPGSSPGKFFPVVEAEGSLRKTLCEAVLNAFEEWEAQQ